MNNKNMLIHFLNTLLVAGLTTPTKTVAAPERQTTQNAAKPLSQKTKKIAHKAAGQIENIEFNFENADLQNFIDYIAELFNVAFLPDDAIKPMLATGKAVAGNKISFKTERPMSKKEVWNLFTTFLNLAGLALANTPREKEYRIVASAAANRMALPTYIGMAPDLLPDNDMHVRYVYFLTNSSVENVKPIIDQLRGPTSNFTAFAPLRALILTDKAYNLKSLMKIVLELDKASLPEVMSVIKLKNTGAEDIKKLYDELTKSDDQRGMVARIFGAKRQADSFFFPENTRVIAEPRSNTLIVFGTQDTIKKIEDFVSQVDTVALETASPLYIYELQHTDVVSMAEIMNKVTQFGIGTVAGLLGGVRDGQKYFKPITFTPEKTGNRLIIKGDYEDYLKAKSIIEQLDVMQPEIAMEVLVINITNNDRKNIGSQMRNKSSDTIGKNINFQNSGFNGAAPVVQGANAASPGSIMANLITLASSAVQGAALLTLGAENNIWAIFQALSTKVHTTVVSNPFLVTSNKYKATVSLGETRRVDTTTIIAGGITEQGKSDLSANLEVIITPQINSDGIIMLDLVINIDEFTNAEDFSSATRTTKHIEAKANVANREILAIGGLITQRIGITKTKLPLLGDIPLLGWLFKNENNTIQNTNLLVLISPQIIQPMIQGGSGTYTNRKADYSRKTLRATEERVADRDPIHRWLFKDKEPQSQPIDDFLAQKHHAKRQDTTTDIFYKSKVERSSPAFQKNPTPLASKQATPKRSLTNFIQGKEGANA